MIASRYEARGKSYCVSRMDVRGTVVSPVLVPAPGAPTWLIGAYNHFGRAVAAVDVGALVGFTAPLRAPPALVLVEVSGALLALRDEHLVPLRRVMAITRFEPLPIGHLDPLRKLAAVARLADPTAS